MNIQYEEKQQKEIDITFPAYVKFSAIYYKLFSEKNIIMVSLWGFEKTIMHNTAGHQSPFGNAGWEFITEEEFNEAFLQASNHLQQFNPLK